MNTSLREMAVLSLHAHLIKLREEQCLQHHAADDSWERVEL